jgi:hypothetical protein
VSQLGPDGQVGGAENGVGGTGPVRRQLARVRRESGARLAARFETTFGCRLRLIGPDAPSTRDTVVRLLGADATAVPTGSRLLPEGFALGYGHTEIVPPDARVEGLFRSVAGTVAGQGGEIWMTGWYPTTARSEQEVLLATAQRLIHDLRDNRANYWLYGSGYTIRHSSKALV